MLSRRNAWSALLLCAALALFAAPTALGQSAGNQQYVDPLASTTPASSSPSSSSAPAPAPTSSQSSAAPSSTSSSSSSSSTLAASTGTTSTASAAPVASSSRTLPFTGLDLWPAVAVGVGLIASGLALRRVARRT